MSGVGNSQTLSRLMQASTQAIYDCQESMIKGGETNNHLKTLNALGVDQAQLLLKLMESLVDTKVQLVHELELGRILYIDPVIVDEMEMAIEMAIADPLDAKINQLYFSIFGYNTPLWHVLKEMQKLLKTVEVLKNPRRNQVANVEKKHRERRRKPHDKDLINMPESEE